MLFRLRYAALALVILTTALFAPYVPQAMKPNNSLRIWFYEDDPNLQAYDRAQDEFGNDEIIAIFFEPPGHVLDAANIALVRKLSEELERLSLVDEVFSLTTADDMRNEGDLLVVEDLLAKDEYTAEERARILEKLKHDPMLEGFYLSNDDNGTMITVQLEARRDIDELRGEVIADVKKILDEHLGAIGTPYHLGGTGVIYTDLNRLTDEDVYTFATLAYLAMFAIIAVLLRSLWGLVYTVLCLTISVIITMGAFGMLGHRINMMTMILPTMVIILSISDCVHIIIHYRMELKERSINHDHIKSTLSFIAVPCILTSLTTFAGIGSLYTARMQVVGELGTFSALGVAVALFVTFAIAPSFLSLVKLKPLKHENPKLFDIAIRKLLFHLDEFAIANPGKVSIAFVTIMIAATASFSLISVDIHLFRYFPDGSRVLQDHDAINDRFGYYLPLEFTLRTPDKDGVKNPQFLKDMERFQQRVEALEDIGESISIANLVFKIHRVLTDSVDTSYPDSIDMVAQEMLLYSFSDPEGIDRYINPDGNYTHLYFKMTFVSGNVARKMIHEIEAIGRDVFGPAIEIRPVGYWPLYFKLVDYALDVQIQSFSVAFIAVFFLIFLMLRDIRLTLLAIPPNIFPICITGALLAATGIDLDFGTASIAAVLLGLAVDDTVHLLYRTKTELGLGAPTVQDAVRIAMRDSGHALVGTTLVLCLGFSVLLLAQVKTVIYFGGLLAVSLGTALVAELLFMPALLCLFYRKRNVT